MSYEEPKRSPQQRIDDIIWDVAYEKIEQVCQSYLHLIKEHHDKAQFPIGRMYLRKLLVDGVKRKKMWMQR